MKLNDNQIRKSYEEEFYYMQGPRRQPIRGILIYDKARKKLDISDDGKLYRQKWWNYLPFVGPITAIIYGNFCIGKVKCLRNKDAMLFNGSRSLINWFAFLFWPLLFLALWTLFTFIFMDFGNVNPALQPSINMGTVTGFYVPYGISYGTFGSYSNLWNQLLVNPLNSITSINSAADFFNAFSYFFGGLFKIFIYPLLNGVYLGYAPANLIFILIFMFFTILNPVNIYNSYVINRPMLRFTIVYETSTIYRYR